MAQSQELADFAGIMTVNTTSNAVTVNGQIQIANQFVIGGGAAAGEGGQIVLGYGNNLATAPGGQANNTWNIDVVGGNTGATPILRFFQQNADGTIGTGFNIANTGRMHVGSLAEQTDSTLKVTGTMNVTTNAIGLGTSTKAANGYTYLTNNIKLQWMTAAVTNAAAQAIAWPTAFSAAPYNVQATMALTSVTVVTTCKAVATNATHITANSTGTNTSWFFAAVGLGP